MKEWNIEGIRKGIKEELINVDGFEEKEIKAKIENFYFGTTDEHIFEVFGKCKAKKKVKALKLCCIKKDKEGQFEPKGINILYGGELTVMEEFCLENVELKECGGNQKYKAVIEDYERKAEEYNKKLDRDIFEYYRRAFVVYDKNDSKVSFVKWIVVEHLYYEEGYEGNQDVYQLTSWDWEDYNMPEHFTMVYVKADIRYLLYDGTTETYRIDDMYDSAKEFFNNYYQKCEEVKQTNIKLKWKLLSGMDIDKMNQLSENLMFEHYLLKGLKNFEDNKVNALGKTGGTYREFLTKQENFDDYLGVLENLMTDCDKEKIKKQFLELRDNAKINLEDRYLKFLKNYLKEEYEIGKIYLAKPLKEVDCFSEESQIVDVTFLNQDAYQQLKDSMLKQYDFSYMILEKLGQIIPVRVIGFQEDGRPITEYAWEWYMNY